MEITEQKLLNICGEQPEGVSYVDPGNDPNFVFTNDPAFDVVRLFDVEGNIVNVNSWVECIHYVKGGWVSTQINNHLGEMYLSLTMLVLSTFLTTFMIYLHKRENKNA